MIDIFCWLANIVLEDIWLATLFFSHQLAEKQLGNIFDFHLNGGTISQSCGVKTVWGVPDVKGLILIRPRGRQ